MLKEAIARSIKDFDNKSLATENHNKIVYAAMLQRLKEKYIAKAYERAVAVPRDKVQEEVKDVLEKRINSMINTCTAGNDKWIADGWDMAISKEYETYVATIRKDYIIPFDETTFDTNALRSQTKARLDLVPKLAGDSEELKRSKAKLEAKMVSFDETYTASNNKKVDEAVQDVIDHELEEKYSRELKIKFKIPFDDVSFNSDGTIAEIQRSVKGLFVQKTSAYLSSKSKRYDKFVRILENAMKLTDKSHLEENRQKVESTVKAWFNEKIYKPVDQIVKKNSNAEESPQAESWADNLYHDMKRIQTDNTNGPFPERFSYGGNSNMIFPSFLSGDRAFKEENVKASGTIEQYKKDLMGVHTRRVKNLAKKLHKKYEDRIERFDYASEEVQDSVNFHFPTEMDDINRVINSLSANCSKEFAADVNPYLKHIALHDFNFLQVTGLLQTAMSNYNNKKWDELFDKPKLKAQVLFHQHLRDCRDSDKYSNLGCIKPSSVLAGLPSIKGKAEMFIYKEINLAIEADRTSKAQKSKSKKSQKDISATRFKKIVKKTVDDWEREDPEFRGAYYAAYLLAAGQGVIIVMGFFIVKNARGMKYVRTKDALEAMGVLALVAFVAYALLFL